MQPVRKESKRRGVSKPAAVLLALIGLALLAFLAYELFFKKTLPQPSGENERVQLIKREADELLRMEVQSGKAEPFVLSRTTEGWEVEGKPDFEMDQNELNLMVKDLATLYANEFLGEIKTDTDSLESLGLGAGAPRVKASYLDGSEYTLVFGDSAQTEIPADYLMFEKDNKVYAVSVETRDHFDRNLESLHRIPKINFNADLVDAVRFQGARPFAVTQQEGLWEMVSPFLYPVDSTGMQALMTSIGNMRLALYAGEASAENLERFGLTEPKRTIIFELSPSVIMGYEKDGSPSGSLDVGEQVFSIALGDDIGGIGLYCLYEGQIYQASNVSMGFLRDTGPETLLSPYPVTWPINRLERMVVVDALGTREYHLALTEKVLPNNQLARDQAGNILYEPDITKNGAGMDSREFMQEYLKLMSLSRNGRLPSGFHPEKNDPVRRYTLMTVQGERELALFHYDELHYAMRVNGTFVDYVNKATADAIAL